MGRVHDEAAVQSLAADGGYALPKWDGFQPPLSVANMRRRRSSRLLILNPDQSVLLFRFVHQADALAGMSYWATPGGGLEGSETFQDAAVRELFEETGIRTVDPGPVVGRREFRLRLASGEDVLAEERFFLIRHDGTALSREGWTEEEVRVMADHRWWSRDDLARTIEAVFPEDILALLPVEM